MVGNRLTKMNFVVSGWRMVEGHQVHRVAIAHRKRLLNTRFRASSPNGKFADGAKVIDGKVLTRVEAHGKNLFYFFGEGRADPNADVVVVHIHFGMSGRFRLHRPPGPEPGVNTRLVLSERSVSAHLSAMTCKHGGMELYEKKCREIGTDPLREDGESEKFWKKVQSTSRSIGLVIMDQSAIAGVGNIYRAEILFRAGVHPEQPSNSLTREEFERIWTESVLLLQRGVKTGSILTVDPNENLPEPWKRRYIYNHTQCPRCYSVVSMLPHGRCCPPGSTTRTGSSAATSAHIKLQIRSWDIAGRRAYACEQCQPLREVGISIPLKRKQALSDGKPHVKFVSHCAPEPRSMTVAALQRACRAAGLSTTGRKSELMARLERIQPEDSVVAGAGPEDSAEAEARQRTAIDNMTVADLRFELKKAGLRTSGRRNELVSRLSQLHDDQSVEERPHQAVADPTTREVPDLPRTGTAHLGEIATAREAEEEKVLAGESKAVEHVGMEERLPEEGGDEQDKESAKSRINFRTRKTRSSSRGKPAGLS